MSDPHAERQSFELRPADSSQIEELVNASFPVEPGRSFFDDFPAWRSDRALWLALFDSDHRAVAAAGALPGEWIMDSKGSSMMIVRIGGVVTRESSRGRGLASRIVEVLVENARTAGAQACVLWGQDSPLYRRLGFEPFGRQVRAPLAALLTDYERTPGILRLEEGLSQDILNALNESRIRWGGVRLSASEAQEIHQYQNTRWVRVLDSEGTLCGYGAFGKGIDLGFQLHEWGGTNESIRMVGRWALSLEPRAEIMGTQPQLESVFGELPGESIVEPLCLAKVFHADIQQQLLAREESLWFWGLDGV